MQTDLIIVAWHRSGIGAWYRAFSRTRQMNQSCGRQTAESAEPCQKPVWNGEVRSSILCLQSIFCSLARWNLIRTWPCAGGAYQLAASASGSSSHPLSSLVPACRAAEEVKAPADPIYSVGTFFAARLDHALLEEKDTSYLLARNSDRFLT